MKGLNTKMTKESIKTRLEKDENYMLKLATEINNTKSDLYNQLAEMQKYILRLQEQIDSLKGKS